jgi:hypothetical protein
LQERPSVEELILIGSHAAAPLQVLAGGSGGFTLFTLPAGEGGGQVPAVGFPSNAKTMYLLQSWAGNWFGTGFLRLWRLRKESGSIVFTSWLPCQIRCFLGPR